MAAPPSVSAVIDNCNYGRFLGQAVDSVLRQDYAGPVECIVVDDGSTDDSRAVIASFGARVRAVLQENRGQAAAFNAGLAKATGEIVCLLDSDDGWARGKLAQVAAAFADPAVGVVQHFLREVDGEGRPLPQRFPPWPREYSLDDFLDGRVEFTATSGLAFRKSRLDALLPIPGDVFYYLDDMLVAKALFGARCRNLPEALGFHRNHGDNLCGGGYWSQKRLARDGLMRRIFHRELRPYLEAGGREFTARFRRLEDLDYTRRAVLLHAMRGERARAARAWAGLLARHWASRAGLFRALTCLLALAHPSLYTRVYELYSRRASGVHAHAP